MICTFTTRAQTAAGERASVESRFVVDMPSAGVLAKSRFAVNAWAYSNSGLAAEISIAPFTNLEFGLAYSGSGFLGNGSIVFQGLPGLSLRWRPLDETLTAPAVVVGVSTQGRGISNSSNQFETYSPGIFVAGSKNFVWLGSLALHSGVNYSFEQTGGSKSPNFWIGMEKTLGSVLSLLAEYNATLDNNRTMEKKGLLNLGLRIATGKGFTFEIQARDLLRHQYGAGNVYRMVRLEYIAAY